MRYLDVFNSNRWPNGSLWGDFDRMFDEVARGDESLWKSVPIEVSESEQAYHLSFDVPGMSKEDIKIEAHGNVLTVSGERKRETQEETRTSVIRSRNYGRFSRSFTLPETVDSEKIQARYNDGVLDVTIPKAEAAKPRQIAVT